ncbi:MAG: extracellular solute-binding protein [Chloroflexota bacterium]
MVGKNQHVALATNAMSRRQLLKGMSIGTLGLALAACAAPAAAPATDSGGDGGSAEGSTVEIWTGFGQGRMADAMTGAIEKFGEENEGFAGDHVIIPWGEIHDKVIQNTASGNPPDAYRGWAWIVAEDAPIGALTDLTDHVEGANVPGDDYWPATWEQMQYKNKFYAMSISTIVNLFYYNKDRMREAGLDADNPPTTLEGWEEAGEALTDVSDSGEIERVGFIPQIPSTDPHNWLAAFGADVWDPDTNTVTADNEKVLSLLNWYGKYNETYGVENIGAFRTAYGGNGFGRNSPEGLYYTGQIAVWTLGSWSFNDMGEYGPDVDFDVAAVPSPEGSGGSPGKLVANMYFVPNGAKNVDGGFAFANFMSSSPFVALNKAVPDSVTPSRISLANDPEVEAASARWLPFARDEILPKAWAVPNMPGIQFLAQQINEAVETIAFDGADPQEELTALVGRVQDEVDNKLAQGG